MAEGDITLNITSYGINVGVATFSINELRAIVPNNSIDIKGKTNDGQQVQARIEFFTKAEAGALNPNPTEIGFYEPNGRRATIKAPLDQFDRMCKVLQSGKRAFFVFNHTATGPLDPDAPAVPQVITSASVNTGAEDF